MYTTSLTLLFFTNSVIDQPDHQLEYDLPDEEWMNGDSEDQLVSDDDTIQ